MGHYHGQSALPLSTDGQQTDVYQVNEYFADTLISGYATNETLKAYVDKYDFYIFPVVNPDGFSYSQTNDRLWRKNRQTYR